MCSSLAVGIYVPYTMAYPFLIDDQHKPKIIFTYSISVKVYDWKLFLANNMYNMYILYNICHIMNLFIV